MKDKKSIVRDANGNREHVFNFAKSGFFILPNAQIAIRASSLIIPMTVIVRKYLFGLRFRLLSYSSRVIVPQWCYRVEIARINLQDYLLEVRQMYDFLTIDDEREVVTQVNAYLMHIDAQPDKMVDWLLHQMLAKLEFDEASLSGTYAVAIKAPIWSDKTDQGE